MVTTPPTYYIVVTYNQTVLKCLLQCRKTALHMNALYNACVLAEWLNAK